MHNMQPIVYDLIILLLYIANYMSRIIDIIARHQGPETSELHDIYMYVHIKSLYKFFFKSFEHCEKIKTLATILLLIMPRFF
jgi:hypothetical protein